MNWISKEFLLAVCFSLLIALVAISWSRPLIQGPPPQANERPQGAAEAAQNGHAFNYARLRYYIDSSAGYCTSERPNQQSEWRKKFLCESKITDVVVAALTLFLAIFTGLLVWVGNKQEKTTRRQMRAFVYVHGMSIYNVAHPLNPLPAYKPTGAEIMSPTEGPLVSLNIRNSGSTPAFRVIHWGQIHLGEFPLKSGLPEIRKSEKAPHSAIPPDGQNTKMVKIQRPLTAEEIAGLRNGTVAIWVYGEISYRDAFRRKRTSKYRLFHNAQTGTLGVSTEMTWAEGGNEAN
jgi:hypothetical protein